MGFHAYVRQGIHLDAKGCETAREVARDFRHERLHRRNVDNLERVEVESVVCSVLRELTENRAQRNVGLTGTRWCTQQYLRKQRYIKPEKCSTGV